MVLLYIDACHRYLYDLEKGLIRQIIIPFHTLSGGGNQNDPGHRSPGKNPENLEWLSDLVRIWSLDPDQCMILSTNSSVLTFFANRGFLCLAVESSREQTGALGNWDVIQTEPETLDEWLKENTSYLQRIWERFHERPCVISRFEMFPKKDFGHTVPENRRQFLLRESLETDYDSLSGIAEDSGLLIPALSDRQAFNAYRKTIYHWCDFGMWTLWDETASRAAGWFGLEPDEVVTSGETDEESDRSFLLRLSQEYPEEKGTAQMGFMLDKEYRGNGLAVKCCERILIYARDELGLGTVGIRTKADNRAAVFVCERLQDLWGDEM